MIPPQKEVTLIVYTKMGCPWCIAVINFLHEKNIDFEERDVTENPDYMMELVEKSGQSLCPTFIINDTVYPDSDKEELEKVLKEEGVL